MPKTLFLLLLCIFSHNGLTDSRALVIGNANYARATKDAIDSKIIFISATDANTKAQELDDIKQGVFTWALLNGLSKPGDYNNDQKIKFNELSLYLSEHIPQKTGGSQEPTIQRSHSKNSLVFSQL